MAPQLLTFFVRLYRFRGKHLAALLIGFLFLMKPVAAIDLLHSNFESSSPADNPWSGVSSTNQLAVNKGSQPAVSNSGAVSATVFGPSVSVGDLNGDGLPDLVIGDPRGFLWFYPNSGTAGAPKFTQGEIMPAWFGATKEDPDYDIHAGGADNIIPRVQLVSFSDTKLLDLVIGNYNGRLFYLHNTGSTSAPKFRTTPRMLKDMLVKTRKDGLLWCNFLCPFLYDWWGTGNLDLIMGDGSYSANSVFLFKNQSNRDSPIFNEQSFNKIIPGMGREHLTPQVVDWNNDGKPDIIAGDRLGHINLFLNTSADAKQAVPTFDAGTFVKLGSSDTFGSLVTATVCDLTNNKLPNLIVTNNAGAISYATNTGKPGAPVFGDPVPMTGTNTFPKIFRPIGWSLFSPYGVPNELLVCTNATVEPGFAPPPNTPFKNALRYWVYPITNKYFPEFYYPTSDQLFDDEHRIRSGSEFATKEGIEYKTSFWIRTTGNITNLTYHLWGWRTEPGEDNDAFDVSHTVGNSGTWTQFSDSISYEFGNKKKPDVRNESGACHFELRWNGQGEIYLDDVLVKSDK